MPKATIPEHVLYAPVLGESSDINPGTTPYPASESPIELWISNPDARTGHLEPNCEALAKAAALPLERSTIRRVRVPSLADLAGWDGVPGLLDVVVPCRMCALEPALIAMFAEASGRRRSCVVFDYHRPGPTPTDRKPDPERREAAKRRFERIVGAAGAEILDIGSTVLAVGWLTAATADVVALYYKLELLPIRRRADMINMERVASYWALRSDGIDPATAWQLMLVL